MNQNNYLEASAWLNTIAKEVKLKEVQDLIYEKSSELIAQANILNKP